MKNPKPKAKSERSMPYTDRASVLDLLSATEVAAVNAAEATPALLQGDEYLDLANLNQGVRRALGDGVPAGRMLPRKALLEKTWNKILMQLPPPRFLTGGPRRD